MSNEIQRADIYRLVVNAVIDGLEKVREVQDSGKYIGKYYRFPKLAQFKSGLPNFSRMYDSEPLNYSDIFGGIEKSHVRWDSIASWREYHEFAISDAYLTSYFDLREESNEYPHIPDWAEWHIKYCTYGLLAQFINRFIHITGSTNFDEVKFRSVYTEWEAATFLQKLPFAICVPILCAKFDFEREELDSMTAVEKMADDFQLARNDRHEFKTSAHKCVIGAATHSVVFYGWTVENKTRKQSEEALNEFGSFQKVIFNVDCFFAALRAVLEIETGYSQLVVRPIGWGHSWEAFLPRVNVVTTRAYPDHFDDYGWLREPPVVHALQMRSVADVYRTLIDSKTNSLAIAARRLNAAHLRKDEADSILDITIGLEALLGDSTKTEMTHKLAMRMAALTSIEPCSEGEPGEIFAFVKKIYAYRSAVVHGSKKSETKRTIANKHNEEIPTVALGIKLLRHTILALARHPKFLDPEKLDNYLIMQSRSRNVEMPSG